MFLALMCFASFYNRFTHDCEKKHVLFFYCFVSQTKLQKLFGCQCHLEVAGSILVYAKFFQDFKWVNV